MARRIDRRAHLETKDFDIAAPEDVEAHIYALRELAQIANRAMSDMLAFELRIKFSISEFETARRQAAFIDLHKTKVLLSPREAARKLKVPIKALRENREGRFPNPVAISATKVAYRRADVDQCLRGGP
jgi:hypothetical protein